MDNLIISLQNVVFSLNCVEVKGRENLNALLGSIQAVEKVSSALERINEKAKKEAAAHENRNEQRKDA